MKLSERFWLAVGIAVLMAMHCVLYIGFLGTPLNIHFHILCLIVCIFADIALFVKVLIHGVPAFNNWLDKMDEPKE